MARIVDDFDTLSVPRTRTEATCFPLCLICKLAKAVQLICGKQEKSSIIGKRKMSEDSIDYNSTIAPSTPMSTAPSTPSLLFNDRDWALKAFNPKKKVAIMKYQFGNYDYAGTNEMWNIPQFDDYEVQGFFYSSPGLINEEAAREMESYGWKSIVVELEEETPYVAGARVTTKKFKFCVPQELREYDFVITHDCDVDADYKVAVPYMLELMEKRGNAALFQQHERGFSTLQEIDLFLKDKPHRILTSRQKCIEWRAEVEELIKTGRYDFSGDAYIKANCFAFRPDDAAFLRAGERIFEKCLYIQRDQFVVPWAVQEENVNYSLVTTVDMEANGFSFPVLLRDARTGVYN